MKYTKYFALITKEQGQINLPPDQFQRMMNIVHIGGVLFGLRKAKETYKNTSSYYKYDILILDEDTKLANLTGKQTPELLLIEMVRFSD